MTKKGSVTVIQTPNVLGPLTNKSGGITPAEAVRRGNATLAKLSADHKSALESKLFQLEALAEGYHDTVTLDEEAFSLLFRIVYDLKGQGTTFGFALISLFGASLLSYLEKVEESRVIKAEIVKLHSESLRAAIDGDISVDDKKNIDDLMKRFRTMIAVALK